MIDYSILHAEINAQHYNPYEDRRAWPVNNVICLGRLHSEADAATAHDFPLTAEEMQTLIKQARYNPRDAILTALALGKARHDKF